MDLKFPNVHRRRFNWRKWLWVAMAVIGLASAALYFFRDARQAIGPILHRPAPVEASLVVNINTATQEEIETIPGIGPALASKIIVGRPYSKIEDLERVYGLGHNLVESLRPYVKVDGETVPRTP